MRIGGGYVASHGLVDFDFLGGYGFRAGGFTAHAVSGIGMDTSTGNQDRLGPAPDMFIIPVAAYWQYGARLSYTFDSGMKFETMYTKQFRTASTLASEKRLEGGVTLMGYSVRFRYTEYLNDLDGFFTPFTADGRSAKTTWIIAGMGF